MTGSDRPSGPRNTGPGDGWAVLSYLLAGMIVWGGAGWLLDRWLGTTFLVLIGLLLGGGGAIYLIYVRYGKS